MPQLFSNNVDTTLAATLTIGGTSATLADGSGLTAPTGGDFELVTLTALGEFEIVRVTARTTNTITITRAQEGTTAREWPSGTRVFADVTAESLERLLQNLSTNANALAAGTGATAGISGVTFGQGATSGLRGVALGALSNAGEEALAFGYVAEATGLQSMALGEGAYAEGAQSLACGPQVLVDADEAAAFGYLASVGVLGVGSLAFGPVNALTPRTAHVGALHAVPKSEAGLSGTNAAWKMSAAGVVILSEALNLKTLQSHTIAVPSGLTFFPEEVGVIVTAADTVSGQPSLRFGITGTEAKFLAISAASGLTAAGNRQRFATLASDDGATTLRSEITTGATGTALSGRVYWRGFAVADS